MRDACPPVPHSFPRKPNKYRSGTTALTDCNGLFYLVRIAALNTARKSHGKPLNGDIKLPTQSYTTGTSAQMERLYVQRKFTERPCRNLPLNFQANVPPLSPTGQFVEFIKLLCNNNSHTLANLRSAQTIDTNAAIFTARVSQFNASYIAFPARTGCWIFFPPSFPALF